MQVKEDLLYLLYTCYASVIYISNMSLEKWQSFRSPRMLVFGPVAMTRD